MVQAVWLCRWAADVFQIKLDPNCDAGFHSSERRALDFTKSPLFLHILARSPRTKTIDNNCSPWPRRFRHAGHI